MPTLSHSQVETFLSCERKHFYSYGLGLTRKSGVSEALFVGSVGHVGIENYYDFLKINGNSDIDQAQHHAFMAAQRLAFSDEYVFEDKIDYKTGKVTPAEQVRKQQWDKAELLLAQYFDHYAADAHWTILEVEFDIEVPISDGFTMPIRVDLVADIPGQGVTAIDHKFQADFFTEDVIALNPQLPKYIAALRTAGYDISKAMYNEIKTRPSAALDSDPSGRFKRRMLSLSENRIGETFREHKVAARRIKSLSDSGLDEWDQSILRSASKINCQHCSFRELCIGDLDGMDRDLIINYSYKKRSK